jgi:hypothetical protein
MLCRRNEFVGKSAMADDNDADHVSSGTEL